MVSGAGPLFATASAQKAQFTKLAEARSMLDKVRVELTSLDKLGDLVTSEDVIRGAGKLVAAGLSPMAMAKLLSDLPEQGPAINAWLASHAQAVGQREQQLDPVLAEARHQLGVSALRALAGHHVEQSLQQAPGAAAPANDLAAGGQPQQGLSLASAPSPASGEGQM